MKFELEIFDLKNIYLITGSSPKIILHAIAKKYNLLVCKSDNNRKLISAEKKSYLYLIVDNNMYSDSYNFSVAY